MTAGFKLLTHTRDGRAVGAVAIGAHAYDLAAVRPATPTVLAVLEDWVRASADLRALAADAGKLTKFQGQALDALTYAPPVLYPNGIYCAGANYKDHVAEMAKAFNLPLDPDPHEVGMPPWCFIKTPRNTLAGHGATITLPAYSQKVDWELEVALVIGRTCKNASIADAMDYVAGYSIINDLLARDHLRRATVKPGSGSPFEYDWISHKNWDGACPMGPWIVPKEDVGDANNLALKLWVNGTLMQDSNTSKIIFNDAELVSFVSQRCTLYPGDVIATGTPAGVGTPRGIFLKSGDEVRITIDGIGTLVNRMA